MSQTRGQGLSHGLAQRATERREGKVTKKSQEKQERRAQVD